MITAEQQIKNDYMDSFHHPQQGTDFNLSELDGTRGQVYGDTDRDGKTLLNGQIKSFPGYKGKIKRGKIYHNINNMWWVILSEYERLNIASFNFFDETFRQRIKRAIPKIRIMVTVDK